MMHMTMKIIQKEVKTTINTKLKQVASILKLMVHSKDT